MTKENAEKISELCKKKRNLEYQLQRIAGTASHYPSAVVSVGFEGLAGDIELPFDKKKRKELIVESIDILTAEIAEIEKEIEEM